jgi:hypothetical protein
MGGEAGGVFEIFADAAAMFTNAAFPTAAAFAGLVVPFEEVPEQDYQVDFEVAFFVVGYGVEFLEEVFPVYKNYLQRTLYNRGRRLPLRASPKI